jgi:hypothetical protein
LSPSILNNAEASGSANQVEPKVGRVAVVSDSNYLSRCASLIESAGPDLPYSVLSLDDGVQQLEAHFSNLRIVPYLEFLRENASIAEATKDRSYAERIFSLAPTFLLDHAGTVREGEWLVYCDSDLYFFVSLQSYLDQHAEANVVLAPHRHHWWNVGRLAKYGEFNVGLVAFRNNEQGLKALRYWANSCLEWCYDRAENGKYADQKYLEHFSSISDGVLVEKSVGANLAPWNSLLKRVFTDYRGEVYVNQDRLVYFHAQGLKLKRGRWILGHLNYLSFAGPRLKRLVYRRYLDRIESWSRLPGVGAFGTSRVPTTWIGRFSASLMYLLSVFTGQTIKRKN